jgi:amino acid permease
VTGMCGTVFISYMTFFLCIIIAVVEVLKVTFVKKQQPSFNRFAFQILLPTVYFLVLWTGIGYIKKDNKKIKEKEEKVLNCRF